MTQRKDGPVAPLNGQEVAATPCHTVDDKADKFAELTHQEVALVRTINAAEAEFARRRSSVAANQRETLRNLDRATARRERARAWHEKYIREYRAQISTHSARAAAATRILDEASMLFEDNKAALAVLEASAADDRVAATALAAQLRDLRAATKQHNAQARSAKLVERESLDEMDRVREHSVDPHVADRIDELSGALAELRANLLAFDDDDEQQTHEVESPLLEEVRVHAIGAHNESLRQRAAEMREIVAETGRLRVKLEEMHSLSRETQSAKAALEQRQHVAKERARSLRREADASRRKAARLNDLTSARQSRAEHHTELCARDQLRIARLERDTAIARRRQDEAELSSLRARAKRASFYKQQFVATCLPARSSTAMQELEMAQDVWAGEYERLADAQDAEAEARFAARRVASVTEQGASELNAQRGLTINTTAAVDAQIRTKRASLASLRAKLKGRTPCQEGPQASCDSLDSASELLDVRRKLDARDADMLDRLVGAKLNVNDHILSLREKLGCLNDQIAHARANLDSFGTNDAYGATKATYLSWLRASKSSARYTHTCCSTRLQAADDDPHLSLAARPAPETTPTPRPRRVPYADFNESPSGSDVGC